MTLQKKKLLIINSSHILMDLTKRILERAGFTVRCAVGLDGAQEQLSDYTPDGIILGNELPDGCGFDYMREQLAEKGIPVMFLSNSRDDELAALNAGANDFLKRPYDYEVLVTRINRMLSSPAVSEPALQTDEPYAWSYEPNDSAAALELLQTAAPGGRKAGSANDRAWRLSRVYSGVAASVAVILTITVLLTAIYGNRQPYTLIPDGSAPLTGNPPPGVSSNDPNARTPGGISIPGVNNVEITAGTTEFKMPLSNPAENPCSLVFELSLKETGETLFKSSPLIPGMFIEDIALLSVLPRGEHIIDLKVRMYSLTNPETIGNVGFEFIIAVH